MVGLIEPEPSKLHVSIQVPFLQGRLEIRLINPRVRLEVLGGKIRNEDFPAVDLRRLHDWYALNNYT